MTLSVLYRGPLSSCNYGCEYCPFAKHHETNEEHAADDVALQRFLSWCETWSSPLSVFFTPWGEAMTQRRYQQALARLTHLPHVQKAAVQTNLSARLDWLDWLDWLDACEPSKLGHLSPGVGHAREVRRSVPRAAPAWHLVFGGRGRLSPVPRGAEGDSRRAAQ